VNGGDQFNLLDFSTWASEYDSSRWREALRTSVPDEAWQQRLEEATLRGRPLGTEAFVQKLETCLSRPLRRQPPGRPAKAPGDKRMEQCQMALEIGN
jgi:hypothetical protein